jgi:hypothetical protein
MKVRRPPVPRRRARQRGAILALAGILLMVFLGMVVLGVDLGYVSMVQGELQASADAASLAAVDTLRDGGSHDDAKHAAMALAGKNTAAGEGVTLSIQNVDFGSYDAGTGEFITPPSLAHPAAVRVTAQRGDNAPDGPLDLLFGGLIGQAQANVSGSAIAAIGERHMVIVQDVTGSFRQEIEDAKDADETLVTAMAAQNLGGEDIGLVTFDEAATERLAITPLHANLQQITDTIEDFEACRSGAPNCAGTHIAPGLDTATSMFQAQSNNQAQKVIVLVSDGMPNPSSRRAPAIAAADRAAAAGISIFTVTLTQETTGGSYGSSGNDAAFNAGLVRGFGKAYDTPNSEDLDDLLLQVLAEIPVGLVR